MLTKVLKATPARFGPQRRHRGLCASDVLTRSSGGVASDLDALPLFFSRKMMDKQTFSSIQATTNTSRYAAAVFHKGRRRFRGSHICLPVCLSVRSGPFGPARRWF